MRLFTNKGGTIGPYARWSDRPSGEENRTCKVAFTVSES